MAAGMRVSVTLLCSFFRIFANLETLLGGFNPGAAIKNAAITATSWFASDVELRVYWQDSKGLLTGYKWEGGWQSAGSITFVPVGTHISAINRKDGTNIRIYYQSFNGSISEECNDGKAWYNGNGAAPTA